MKTIKLWENDIPYLNPEADTPNSMDCYFVETWLPAPCVVILPGGGYSHRAPHEGGPIAEYFNSRGIHAVVVNYRVAPNRYPASLADAQRAIKLLRANAKAWAVDPNHIFTLGFSAGGHLSACCATLDDVLADREDADEIDKIPAKPNGCVLCYACVSFDREYGHFGCGVNFLGAERAEKESVYFSLENRVADDTPPTFIWHTSDDNVVNVIQAMRYGEALRRHGIPFEMHVYPNGPHGLGLAPDIVDISTWPKHCADWMIRQLRAGK
ncbi:MAG: alpha/beta hydrolase [Ruminococcaceae bacterium]|nr:alpha/beta hydrolase [Oscillospiraceae bacterium]